MDVMSGLALAFETERPRLMRVAYSITGSLTEAEDCVQEAWLRLQRVLDPLAIRDLPAWLTTTVCRLALDVLDSARMQREQYVGEWLPEPIVEDLQSSDPSESVALDESVSMALLVVLERLSSAERTSFLLHDVFGLSFEEIAEIVGRTPAAVRKLASRARQHVDLEKPRFAPTREEQTRLVRAFAAACQDGDLEQLVALLDPEAVWRGDGGGKVSATNRAIRGARTIAQGLLAFTSRPLHGYRIALVNGAPGLVLQDADGVLSVIAITVDRGLIASIDVIRNPEKLASVSMRDLR